MRKFLQSWGQWAFVHKWWIILFWIIVLAVGGVLASQFAKPTTSDLSIPGTEAQKTLTRYNELFSETGQGSSRVVFASPDGKMLSDYQGSITELVAELANVDGVTAAYSPFTTPGALSDDGTIGFSTLQLSKGVGGDMKETRVAVNELLAETRQTGLQVELGGDLIDRAPEEILGIGEVAGVAIALIVLVITLGSLVAAGMPIIVALITIGASMAGLFSLSQVMEINSTTPVLAVMLGLAVGIDYSLFIINHYKTALLEGRSNKDAIAEALGVAGSAVIYAAATVVIALSALAVVNIPFMTSMGLTAAATVALAALVSVTLIPALLGIVRTRAFGRKTQRKILAAQKKGYSHTEHVSHNTFWFKWGQAITKRPILITIATVVIAGVLAIPALDLKMSLPFDEYAAKESTQHKAYDLVSEGFGAGFNAPLLVLVEDMPAVTDTDRDAVRQQIMAQYQSQLAASSTAFQQQNPMVQQQMMAQLEAQVEQYAPYVQLQKIADNIAGVQDVKVAVPVQVTDGGTKGVIQVIPATAPGDAATAELISHLRNEDNRESIVGSTGASLGVTGATALMLDVNQRLADALPVYLGVVIGLSFILLVIAFRSVLIPIKATLGFLLSVSAMFGALVAVYQWGWLGLAEAPGPIISFIPIIAIGILFGLAMDYEFFVISSMHDARQRTNDPYKAVYRGFSVGSKVVTAAAIIMISVFAGFITNHDATIQALGFALAFGILIDAFLIRMTFVPAVMTLLRNAAWWPFIPKKIKEEK